MEAPINLNKYLPKNFICKNNIIKNSSINSINKFIKKYPTTMYFINEYTSNNQKRRLYNLRVAQQRAILREQKKQYDDYCENIKQENIRLHDIVKKLQIQRTQLLNSIIIK
jgi:hypothetical protein